MREILFRGKRVDNGKWVYGFYIENELFDGRLEPSIIPVDEKGAALYDDDGYNIEIKVDPETVGQYTGLTDKNGARIFEGDIVKISNDEIFEVKYEDGGFTAGLFLGDWDYGHVEVIGNIYDNPELIGGG